MAERKDQLRKFFDLIMKVPDSNKIELQWVGIFPSKRDAKRIQVKVDFLRMDDKHLVASNVKELVKFNENRKPATIWSNDMTDQQRNDEKKRRQKKQKK
uniref:Uncharacterized protein n=1 Tax=Romanomermis culicivorax TaxID=13658 RepID=A0A915HJS4_ROMCU